MPEIDLATALQIAEKAAYKSSIDALALTLLADEIYRLREERVVTPAECAVLEAAVAWAEEDFRLQETHCKNGWQPNRDAYAWSPVIRAAEALARERRGG